MTLRHASPARLKVGRVFLPRARGRAHPRPPRSSPAAALEHGHRRLPRSAVPFRRAVRGGAPEPVEGSGKCRRGLSELRLVELNQRGRGFENEPFLRQPARARPRAPAHVPAHVPAATRRTARVAPCRRGLDPATGSRIRRGVSSEAALGNFLERGRSLGRAAWLQGVSRRSWPPKMGGAARVATTEG